MPGLVCTSPVLSCASSSLNKPYSVNNMHLNLTENTTSVALIYKPRPKYDLLYGAWKQWLQAL